MKRILALLIIFIISLTICGCKNTNIEKTPIKVNLPTDNSVNGYRETNSNIEEGSIILNETTETYKYFGNKNSKKFHKASCSALKSTKDENKVFYKTREEFISYNYVPCKMCNP